MSGKIMCNHGYHLFKCQKCIDALVAEQIEKQSREIEVLKQALHNRPHRIGKSFSTWIAVYAQIIEKLFTLIDAANCPQCGDKSGAYYDNNGEVCQCQWCDDVGKLKANWDGRS